MYVYILKSQKDNSLYIGATKNVGKRLLSHNNGSNLATKTKKPWKLLRVEEFNNVSLALQRERFLKSGRGREVLKNICSGK
jgi:putative endonuclease